MKRWLAAISRTGGSILSLAVVLMFTLPANTQADEVNFNGHELNTKLRYVFFDRDYENDSNDRMQSAAAFQANYKSPQFFKVVGVGLSTYVVEELNTGGAVREDILTVDDGELDGYGLLGQAYINLTFGKIASLKVGRQLHKSMFLSSSGSRAVPNTFKGVSAKVTPAKGLTFYAAGYDEWSRRARDEFEGFATDQSAEGEIDYVGLFGVKYKIGKFAADAEYLVSEDYLRKIGLRGSYTHSFSKSSLKFTGGIFTSSDDGNLFVTRAESGDLDDEDVPGSVAGVTPSENDGLGGYIDVAWKRGNAGISLAYTKIDEIWIEDNFTGDHGTNPFPTRSRVGPDLTNTNESVVRLLLSYNWKDLIPGLTTNFAIAQGRDAENSVDSSLGSADEDWWEIYLRYKAPFLKGLKFTAIYHDYSADETGSVDGVKGDERDIRIYMDYSFTFK